MAWLESHGNLARHPKTRRLMQRMGWTLPHTIGNLHLLWYWALEYAPTGDLTKFDPEQLTYDLDLGGATPEQFLDAMISAGFLDRGENNTLRLHDWPDYTARSLRPRFRKTPDRWHDVLRSYGRPVVTYTRRTSRSDVGERPPIANSDRNNVPAPEHTAPSGALREPKMVGNALRAVPYIAQTDFSEPDSTQDTNETFTRPTSSRQDDTHVAVTYSNALPGQESRSAPALAGEYNRDPVVPPRRDPQAEVPKSLDAQPGFSLTWWPKFQEMYKNQGSPLDAWEQTQALAKLAENPPAAVQTLKNSIKTLIARPDLLKRKSIANTS